MSPKCIIVERPEEWAGLFPDEFLVISPTTYLLGEVNAQRRGLRVVNLSRSYGYLTTGYYCSLLADARKQRVIPSPRTVLELRRQVLPLLDTAWIDERAERALRRRSEDLVELDLCFGETDDPELRTLCSRIYLEFPCPLLRVVFRRTDCWHLREIRAGDVGKLDAAGREALAGALSRRVGRASRGGPTRSPARFDIAILWDPEEAMPPSGVKALKAFEREGRLLGLEVERIRKTDLTRLGEFDALFIRATTEIEHYTFRFARKGIAEGLIVIDDPDSIIRCANKVFLAETLRAAKIPSPNARILAKGRMNGIAEELGYPVVLKIPDGSFSRGVVRADDPQGLAEKAAVLFKESDLILAQEYLFTDFDWRIGVLDRQPLYACRYFMVPGHWQIVDHSRGGPAREGGSDCVPLEEVPKTVLDSALAAANLIGDGLYGIDLKQFGDRVVVIEVNDNPSIDAGVEDELLGPELYRKIMECFLRRLERRSTGEREQAPTR